MNSYCVLIVVIFFAQQLICGASVSGNYSQHDKLELLKEILGRYFLHPDNYWNDQRKIAFSARLMRSLSNMKVDQPIKFDKVLNNEGTGYDPSTGFFTAPEPGMYVFSWTFLTNSKKHAHVFLYKNHKEVWRTYAYDAGDRYETGGGTTTLKLARGDKIQLRSGSGGSTISGAYCGFTGFCLY